jgi:hypothetical protein
MPVESKITPDQSSQHKWHYPALGVSIGGGNFLIVLFDKHGEGTCLYKGQESGVHVGGHMTAWDMKLFEPWRGKVVLENVTPP